MSSVVQSCQEIRQVKSECLPFNQIPHSTKLFTDFLSYQSSVQQFYPRSPFFTSWLRDEAATVRYDPARREQVASVLERQNRTWGASSNETLENLARFRSGALAAVTGQQVGLFGGPVFSIYKALTAVRHAQEATLAGFDTVPIFWLATEDHDLEEVKHTSLLTPEWSLQEFATPTRGVEDAPVGRLTFGEEIKPIVDEASTLLGEGEFSEALRNSYRLGETFGSAFARLFTRLFADWGVILLDASDPELHQIAKPIFLKAAQQAEELDAALLNRGKMLESAGYHQQVKVTPSSTLLFYMGSGSRVVVHRRTNGKEGNPEFNIGEEKLTQSQLLQRIEEAPHDFSANVLLRPVMQDYLLPTLAYSGGAAEVAYFAQVAVVYQAILGRVTPVLPRFSATIIEPKPQTLLDKYGLRFTDLFSGPEVLREQLAARVLPNELQSAFARAEASLEQGFSEIQSALERLDPTLVDSAKTSSSKIRHQLEQLRARAARAELQKTEVLGRHAGLLSNMLYPDRALQERTVNGLSFLARQGPDLLHQIYDTIHTDCMDHQVITLT